MAMFKGALSKEGKGVRKGESDEKSVAVLFLEIYSRKFWKICQAALLFLGFGIPTFVVTMLLSGMVSSHMTIMLSPLLRSVLAAGGNTDPGILMAYEGIFDLVFRCIISLLIAALWGLGPVSAGFATIIRNYAREEHAWVWGDFIDGIKRNFFKAFAVWVLDMALLFLFVNAFMFYSTTQGPLQYAKFLIAFLFLLYTIMHFYIYQIMVSYKVGLGEIFRNSLLFTMLGLPSNLLALVITVIVHLAMPYMGAKIPYFGGNLGYWTLYIIIALCVLQGLTGFLIGFTAQRNLKKYVAEDATE